MPAATYATRHNRMTAVTPKQVEDAKQAAIDAHRIAYEPHPIPQPDGTTLDLCLQGRLDRAYRMMGDADADLRKKLQPAVAALSAQVKAAYAATTEAAAKYAELALAAGLQPETLPETQCTCAGCQTGIQQAAYFRAEAELRSAVFALLTPDDADDPLPVLATLLEASESDAAALLQGHLQRIAGAQRRYAEACVSFSQRPDWQRVCGL